MAKPPLLKAQGQALAEVIQRTGFQIADFELTARPWDYFVHERKWTRTTDSAPTLLHRASGFFFMFVEVPQDDRYEINRGEPFRAEWSPSDEETVRTENNLTWPQLLLRVEEWLAALNRELTGPDVWDAIAETRVEPIDRGGDLFDAPELNQVDEQLDTFFEYARATYDLGPEAVARIETDLAYLKEAARRLPRLDWRNAALGTVMGWLVSGIVPVQAIPDLFKHMVHIVEVVTAAIKLLLP